MTASQLFKLYPRRAFPIRRAIVNALVMADGQRLSISELARKVYRLTRAESRNVAHEYTIMATIRVMRDDLGYGWLEDVGIRGAIVIALYCDRV